MISLEPRGCRDRTSGASPCFLRRGLDFSMISADNHFPMILPLLRNFKSPGRHSFGEKTYFCALLNDNRLKTKELWPVIKTKTWINSVTLSAWE